MVSHILQLWLRGSCVALDVHCGGEREQAKGLDVMWLNVQLLVRGVPCTAGKGKLSTWLHDGWIWANKPKSTGREECVTNTDGIG